MEENFIENFINNLLQNRKIKGDSIRWANWISKLTLFTCKPCAENHGKIFDISILKNQYEFDVNAHDKCKCKYTPMRTKTIGTATDLGYSGADAQLSYFGKLPKYYITKNRARELGWVEWKGNLHDVLPDMMIGGDVYKNREGKLPCSPNRLWYEADINYEKGYRNRERILYSNDGLIFVTYDHYQTFYEITA